MFQKRAFTKKIDELKLLVKKGFFHIFGGQTIIKIIGFVSSFALIRILSKEEYGHWSYAYNIYQMILLFAAFGAPAGILQFCSRTKSYEDRLSYLKYGLNYGTKANLILALAVLLISIFIPLSIPESNIILFWLSFLPLLSITYESLTLYLRSTFRNRAFAGLAVVNSAAFLIASIIGAYAIGSIGVAVGRYCAMGISIITGIVLIKKDIPFLLKAPKLDYKRRKEFIRFAVIAMLTNSISSMLYKIDTFLVGTITENAEIVATYKTATLIPFNLNFIPLSIMTFAYPYFARNQNNKLWAKQQYKKMAKILALFNAIISIILIAFAPWIIRILFGDQYTDSVLPFQILSFGYFIAGTFRIPAGNTLVALGKIRINLINSLISGTANIILDIILIIKYGAVGAAIATVSVFILSSLISNGYLGYYFKKN